MTRRRDPYEERPSGRTEPTLGDLSGLDEKAEPSTRFAAAADERLAPAPPPPPPRHWRGWLIVVVLLLAAVVAVAWVNQSRLRGMVPRTALNDVLSRAQQALQQGHLVGSDGSSARELFQAVLAMEPDNDAAQKGLQQVGRDLVADADASLRAGNAGQAALQAAQARELLGGGSDLDQLDRRIQAARAPGPATPDLVARAQQALAAGKLDGADGAVALYTEIAHADPGSAVARHGLDQVGVALAARAQQALAAHDLGAAETLVQQLTALQPSNGALPALRAALAQAQGVATAGSTATAVASAAAATAPTAPTASPQPPPPAAAVDPQALAAELDQGQAALRAGRIAGSGNDTALAHYRAALKLDPDNATARDGLRLVARALTVQANVAIDLHDGSRAASLLDQAAVLDPDSAQVAAARARLGPSGHGDTAVKTAGDAGNADLAMAAPMALTPQQRAEIADLVRKAKAATQRGDIMMPPGDSAYDLYRSALAINGNDPAALQGMHDLPGQVRARFQDELAAGKLAEAGNTMADYVALVPNDTQHAAMAARLAGAWLDQARQQLAQGNRAGAAQALDHARRLAPHDPRVAELSAQLARS
jgi:tetratricopeptide (TPR) repeat protein